MTTSVTSSLLSAGYSWSPTGKDRNADGKITREEFDLPVAKGTLAAVPADLSAAGSIDDAFDSYDRNRDNIIDQAELAAGARETRHRADRFNPGWAHGMSTQQMLTYLNVVNADNDGLAQKWDIKV